MSVASWCVHGRRAWAERQILAQQRQQVCRVWQVSVTLCSAAAAAAAAVAAAARSVVVVHSVGRP